MGTAFTDATRPHFTPGGIWAPDINKIGNTYVLFYALSAWGGTWACGIGTAVASTPQGPFTDQGKLFISSEIGVQNSIDPCYIDDNGKKYLFWGSFHGIYGIELSDDGLNLKQGATPRQIAGTYYEGTCIHKRNGYYYLFASMGSCCDGLNSTYQTVVGRADNLWGPYLNKNGGSMMNNQHEVLIHKSANFVGTGHNANLVTDKAGRDWILYHAHSINTNPEARVLLLDQVVWTDNWPSVKNAKPSDSALGPLF